MVPDAQGRSDRSTAQTFELLCACARAHWNPDSEQRLRGLLQGPVDWAAVIRRARPHGLIPLLAHHLGRLAPELVPEPTLAVLQDLLEENRRRNRVLSTTLAEVLERFDSAGIRAIPFKGLPLAAAYFGDPAVRQTGDVDLLIPKSRALAAHDLLVEAGFRRFNPLTGESEPVSTAFPRNEISFVRDEPAVALDLHWHFLPRYYFFRFDFESLWRNRQTLDVEGLEVPGLANEELLLMLTAHGAKHYWPRLQWLADLEAVVVDGVDWHRLWPLAERLGGQRMLLLGLLLAQRFVTLELPTEVERRIAEEPEIAEIAGPIVEQLEAAEFRAVRRIDPALFVRLRERRRDRLRVSLYHATLDLRLAFTPSEADRAFLPLPRGLRFLHYVVRPLRLLAKHGLEPLRPLLGMLVPGLRRR